MCVLRLFVRTICICLCTVCITAFAQFKSQCLHNLNHSLCTVCTTVFAKYASELLLNKQHSVYTICIITYAQCASAFAQCASELLHNMHQGICTVCIFLCDQCMHAICNAYVCVCKQYAFVFARNMLVFPIYIYVLCLCVCLCTQYASVHVFRATRISTCNAHTIAHGTANHMVYLNAQCP